MGAIIEGIDHYRFREALEHIDRARGGLVKESYVTNLAEPGDLLFVRTPHRLISAGRAITRNPYDHVAVVMEEKQTLNIVNPRTKILPVSYFSGTRHQALLMRPQWDNAEQQGRFLMEMSRFSDCRYNVRKTILGIAVSILYTWFGIRIHLGSCEKTGAWICTEAILSGLEAAIPGFRDIDSLRLEYHILGFATTSDFFRIARARPELLLLIQPIRSRG